MNFDAHNAKLLKPREHITLDGYPGLRLEENQTLADAFNAYFAGPHRRRTLALCRGDSESCAR